MVEYRQRFVHILLNKASDLRFILKDENISIPSNVSCFIIGHHISDRNDIPFLCSTLLQASVKKFVIFGEFAEVWGNALRERNTNENTPEIWSSTTDFRGFTKRLSEENILKTAYKCYLFSDDFAFSDYLEEDTNALLLREPKRAHRNWADGIEFVYENKVCIVSLTDCVLIGFLNDLRVFTDIEEAFSAPIGFEF